MSEARWRWTFARLLDRFPSVCWANAVGWVQGDRSLREVRQDRHCAADFSALGDCYCGKLRVLSSALSGSAPGLSVDESGGGVQGSPAPAAPEDGAPPHH